MPQTAKEPHKLPITEIEDLGLHPLERVQGFNEPDYRGISDEPHRIEEFEEQPMTLRSSQLAEAVPDTERVSGIRSKTPEQLLIEEQERRKTG